TQRHRRPVGRQAVPCQGVAQFRDSGLFVHGMFYNAPRTKRVNRGLCRPLFLHGDAFVWRASGMLRRNWWHDRIAGNFVDSAQLSCSAWLGGSTVRGRLGFEVSSMGLPSRQGLYDPRNEHDACGVGFVANIKGAKSHDIITQGLQLLINLDHRGAVGADPLVGDGAGILIQIPDTLLREWAKGAGVALPRPGEYAVAMCFLPQEAKAREIVVKQFEHFIKVEGQKLLGWRDVRTDPAGLGKTVLDGMPLIRQ